MTKLTPAGASAPKRRRADADRSVAAILDAALDLFAAKGFFGTSLRDVATAVGVRESALYNYFPGKHALFEALIAADHEQKAERLAPLGPLAVLTSCSPGSYCPAVLLCSVTNFS